LYLFRSFNENGLLYFDQGRLSASLHHFLMARQYIPKDDQTLALADVSKSIGAAYLRLGQLFNHINPQKASQYFRESSGFNQLALQLYGDADQLYGSCACKIAMMEAALTEGKWIAQEQLPEDVTECWNVPDYFIQISLLRLEAKNASIKGNHLQAVETLQKAGNNKYRLLAPLHFYHARLDLAVLLRKQDATMAAYDLAYEAASWFEERGLRLKTYEALNHLALWHEEDGQLEKALELSKKASLFKNLLVNESDMEIFDELRYKYQTDELQTQLQKAVEKERRQRKQWLVTLAVFGLVAVFLVLLLLVIASKRKKALLLKQLAEEKSAKLAEETKVKKLELEHIKTENELIQQKAAANVLLVEKKEQELLLNALRRTEVLNFQNTMLERLLPFVTKLNRKTDRDAFESMLADLRNESDADPMQQFETVFKQAYGDFYTKLAETAPDLSRSEIQVAVLLRLNLTSKEIAHILCLTTATVERTRHQLRQKLNLEPNQQLVAWLMGLG
jgi:DNA-binding CsgD family transcriptional regulator/Na+-transporting methylmalonyl-CoA/oxaloacetate decarboxylase gamma subunit